MSSDNPARSLSFLRAPISIAQTILGFFYPEICQICGTNRATAKDAFVCQPCRHSIQPIHPPYCGRCGLPFQGHITDEFQCSNCRDLDLYFSSARSAVVAKTVVLEAIHRYKYQRQLWFEPFLAGLLLREALPALRQKKWDFIVSVPLHPVKQREREFNQSARLAGHLSAAARIPLHARLLRRVLPTMSQTRLAREQRAANMRHAFAMRDGLKLDGEKIILVDDVFTTGATTNACAKILRQAGAAEVCVWTVARGL
jgi:competence protein ComFC